MKYEEIVDLVRNGLKKTAKNVDRHIAVEFDIYGEGEGSFYVEVKDSKVNVMPFEYYDRDAKIITTSDELLKIIKKEKSLRESIMEGITMIEGNTEKALEMEKLIKKSGAQKSVKVEKSIVEETKKSDNPIKKDILK